ncbi:MAG: hypothetical protein KKB90_07135 [Actinobacteria bacterium]|nr:hypothetical protein [Actinomycetota bacterium]MCG2819116.1 hypothetical protein [Actinomycetes bacterium]MBU4218723.1 hypothetical protein [Actinomycetota bacterium]MBU4359452.1 hypothetical protein [Actinomycetota bacterium]MBU4391323.1 hypothetical protein [Actinomycetota bacterium]
MKRLVRSYRAIRVAVSLSFLPLLMREALLLHMGHEKGSIHQDVPGFIIWLMSRYEHLMMRTLNYLAMRDWMYRRDLNRRIMDFLSRRMMSFVNGEVLTLDEVRELLGSIFEGGYTVAIGTCPCRRALNMLSDDVPNNTDMVIGLWAEEYLRHYPGLYHRIDKAEAEELVESFDRYGYVHQLYGFRSQEGSAYVLCNCNKDVCIPLRTQKERGYQSFRKGRSLAMLDEEACLGVEECGACLTRCPFDARVVEGGKGAVKEDMCFGCGLCVTTCKGKATTLERKKGAKLIYARRLVS